MDDKADRIEVASEGTDAPLSLAAPLARVRALLAQREVLERALAVCEMDLRAAWATVPPMPIRDAETLAAGAYRESYRDNRRSNYSTMYKSIEAQIHESREKRMLRAAGGDKGVADVWKDLLYG